MVNVIVSGDVHLDIWVVGFARGMKFIPEERAKKLSFDRMIFKLLPTEETKAVWDFDFEYRSN